MKIKTIAINKFLQITLIPHLSLLIALLANPVRSQSGSTSFEYDFLIDEPTTFTGLIYEGGAHFPSDIYSLRLTATNATSFPLRNSVGRVVHSTPVTFRSGGLQADFETNVDFIITTVDSSLGEGLTFFMEPVGNKIPPGSVGGNFGIFNPLNTSAPSIFAVEFDTNSNEWDPEYRHVGIDIGSKISSNLKRMDDVISMEVSLRINYVGATKLITASVETMERTFEVSYVYDLSSFLPEQVQVGISSSTGDRVAIYDVVSWEFTSTTANAGVNDIRQVV